jgi:5-methyltetrahydrofolate--homocysteine methyltransferase
MDFLTFLHQQDIIILDGAMGTQLAARGLSMGGQTNLTDPDQVLDIHRQYARSGCHILTTNTLTMNRVCIREHHLGIDVRAVNLTGTELVKQAANNDQFVLGDLSSTGKLLEPYGNLTEPEAYDAFAEQAACLVEGGVDGLIVETMFSLDEALCALRACREVTNLPVLVSMAFKTDKNGGRTIMGDSAVDCAKKLTEQGAQAVGANCGEIDPMRMTEIVSILCHESQLPVLVKPNAGKPELAHNLTRFYLGPKKFAFIISECIKAGARLLGGCCGTTPEHISALSALAA